MSYINMSSGQVVANQSGEVRAAFIRKTYAHVAGSIVLLAVLESFLLKLGLGEVMLRFIGGGMMNALIYMGLFIGAGVLADKWARSETSKEMQYVGLGLYIVVQAVILLPAMFLAKSFAPHAISNAAVATAGLVTALTYICFTTRKDFSFMGPGIAIAGIVAVALMFAGVIFGFGLGIWFAAAIVGLAAAALLYETSNVLHHYGEHQHVSAALSLFAAIALMFRFLLHIFMSFGDD